MDKELKEKLFLVLEQKLPLKDFEAWLYQQTALSERMNEDVILTAYTFNYNQDGAYYVFSETFFPFVDCEEFLLWKIKANLSDLVIGTQQRDRILYGFCNLGYRGYTFLYSIGTFLYSFENSDYCEIDVEKVQKELSSEASQLLIKIETKQKEDGFSILSFCSSQDRETIASEINREVWWKLWT